MRRQPPTRTLSAALAGLVLLTPAIAAVAQDKGKKMTAPVSAAAPQSIGFIKLNVNDLEVMQKFYETAFGMKVIKSFDLPPLKQVHLAGPSGAEIGLMKWKDGRKIELGGNAVGPIGLYVDDVRGVYDRAIAAGGKSVKEPAEGYRATVGFVADPEGHVLQIVRPEP